MKDLCRMRFHRSNLMPINISGLFVLYLKQISGEGTKTSNKGGNR